MFHKVCTRTWLSPFTALTFAAIAVSGVLLLFHVRLPYMKSIHEWMGLMFVIACVLHLALNWQPLLRCFKWRAAYVALGAALALCIALAFTPQEQRGGRGPGGPPGLAAETPRAGG